ncbi:hypothetical protein CDV36_012228 [Fusarium kuroshium]|uniref:Rhodopsin domain-containing protein n=2 Tax=Fusarium solani species complex TaxID=232080 RepID=A0A3M2RS86_9HYPO|nr:hypothetical protein CDV36_012228 [Fusarium kuroshium]RSL58880.1 hypothetical protein CEP51_014011 [Fusarium floridanum]
MAVDPNATTVEPTGLGRTLLGLTLFFPFPVVIVIVLRCWVRLKHKVFGVDDGLMVIGWGLYMGVTGVVARGVYAGIGTRDVNLNAKMQSDGRRFLYYFQVIYCCSLLFIKGSICVMLLRIAVGRTYRIILWATLIFSTLSTTVVIIGLFVICRPISAAWGHPGKCSPTVVIASLGYLVSTGAVVTDWTCAILPGFMLYKTNMKTSMKISITIILGLGVLASVATIIRFPDVKYYTQTDDYLYNVANIVIWSIVESGVGITASSLPSLGRLLKNRLHTESSSGQPPTAQVVPYAGSNRATITTNTSTGSRPFHKSVGSSTVGDEDRDRFDDGASSRKIYVQVDLEMQSLERPMTPRRSHGSQDELVRQ